MAFIEPPVIVDVFDYHQVYQDIVVFRQLLGEPLGHEFLGYQQEQFEQLLFSPFAPALHFVQYRFGSGNVPRELSNSSLAVNLYGPPLSTLEEQLSILAPNGAIWMHAGRIPNHINAIPLPPPGSYIIPA